MQTTIHIYERDLIIKHATPANKWETAIPAIAASNCLFRTRVSVSAQAQPSQKTKAEEADAATARLNKIRNTKQLDKQNMQNTLKLKPINKSSRKLE